MAALPAHGPSDGNDGPAPTPDPMSAQEWEAWLDHLAGQDEPFDPEEYPDPDGPPPPGEDELTPAEATEVRDAVEAEARGAAVGVRSGTAGALAVIAAQGGRRGPGQPGSARVFPGESGSRAAAFGTGLALDVMPGGPDLAVLADAAAGPDDAYAGASDAELTGVLSAWDRLEAHMAARKLAAVAELIRRRPEPGCGPAPGCGPEGAGGMPAGWEEFAAEELGLVLAEGRGAAEDLLACALALAVRLPGTRVALRDGLITRGKAQVVIYATALLDAEESRAAEEMVLGRAGRLTPAGLRAAIARAVIQVAPEKARKRREAAARDARVQRWAEDSGNAALMGRELPPAETLAADQRITAWARQLRAAGLDGDMDVLRARAYLDLLLGKDSRPRPGSTGGGQDSATGPDSAGPDSPDSPDSGGPDSPDSGGPDDPGGGSEPGRSPATGPGATPVPAGFAGKITLTIPLATLLGLAARPAEIPGLGPVDPWLARTAAASPRTTWCVTVTEHQHGHAIGHGCARPGPKNRQERANRQKRGPPDGPDPPRAASNDPKPGFAFTATSTNGPPGGYGTWKLRTGTSGQDLLVALDPITTQDCDHRFQATGHDPGGRLRHLTQVRNATCTSPICRRPATQCDYEHNTPYQADGRTCLCNGGPTWLPKPRIGPRRPP